MRKLVTVIDQHYNEQFDCTFFKVRENKSGKEYDLGEYAFPSDTKVGEELMVRVEPIDETSERVLSGGYYRPNSFSRFLAHISL